MARDILEVGQSGGGTFPQLPADDDLVLVAENGNIYWLKKAEYTDEKFRVAQEGRLTDQIDMLRSQGVLLAVVPSAKKIGVGAACYLVNLRDLRRQSDSLSTPFFPPEPSQPGNPNV